jgi:acetyl-CoA C-acetyltransferase
VSYVFAARRTPRGAAKETGALRGVKPVELVAQLLAAMRAEHGLDPAKVDDLVLGCSTQVGDQGANLAKIALLYSGWPDDVSGMTVNRFCISGLEAVAIASAKVTSGMCDLVLAGGVESMSRVPMMSDRGAWFADAEVAKATRFVHMGIAADLIASLDGRTREELDRVAVRSHARAAAAAREGRFARSIVPVKDRDGRVLLDRDECVREGITEEKLARFPSAFAELGQTGGDALALSRYPQLAKVDHHHTVGTAPAMVDGASLVLVGSLEAGRALGLSPRAKIAAYATHASDPVAMLGSPAPATRKALAMARRELRDVMLFEHNESFAGTVLRYERELEIDPERSNACGGAIALGHPLGATGGILVGTILDEMERRDVGLGVVAICAGAGLGAAMVLERV